MPTNLSFYNLFPSRYIYWERERGEREGDIVGISECWADEA